MPRKKIEFYKKHPHLRYFIYNNALSILTFDIHKKFNLNYYKVKKSFKVFERNMRKNSFIDHGYYSSLIVMKWYHNLIKITQWNPAYFYYPIVDIASAILLHNYYKNCLMKPPVKLGKHKVDQHPISYLLILCDELQDWYREGYGVLDCSKAMPIDFKINISENELKINYEFNYEGDYNKYNIDRYNAINNVLEISDIFENGIFITSSDNFAKVK